MVCTRFGSIDLYLMYREEESLLFRTDLFTLFWGERGRGAGAGERVGLGRYVEALSPSHLTHPPTHPTCTGQRAERKRGRKKCVCGSSYLTTQAHTRKHTLYL